ncbi:hypothetical protein [Escherichia coli]|uniref:hypothetical protein n=1 Tax=Escherichia coli TaxID=562 RepID=UPI003AB94199
MNMEEIVALSVKHNVSDLHLCIPPHHAGGGRQAAARALSRAGYCEFTQRLARCRTVTALAGTRQIDFALTLACGCAAARQRLRPYAWDIAGAAPPS